MSPWPPSRPRRKNRALYERLGYTVYGRKEMGSMPGNFYTLLTKPVQRQPDRTVATYETMAEDYLARQTEGSWREVARSLQRRAAGRRPACSRLAAGLDFDARIPRGRLHRPGPRPHLGHAAPGRVQRRPAHPGRQPGAAAAGRQRGRRVGQRLAPASIAHRAGDRAGRDPPLLRPGGVFYSSFKRGDGQREGPDGRWFAFYQPDEVTRMLAGAGLIVADQWESDDNRPGQPSWIKTVARAEGSAEVSDAATDECGNRVGSVELNG